LTLGDPVPHQVKLDRLAVLQARQKGIQEIRNAAWVGRVVEVLVEGPNVRHAGEWTGRTPENRVVNFSGDGAPGRLVRVEVTRSSAFSLHGRTSCSA
jgi:tRNA-2-methylthio-N6-dimethylallyladenosine synthase